VDTTNKEPQNPTTLTFHSSTCRDRTPERVEAMVLRLWVPLNFCPACKKQHGRLGWFSFGRRYKPEGLYGSPVVIVDPKIFGMKIDDANDGNDVTLWSLFDTKI
jgi:hypothetical protein